ncbi:putative sugar lactone lactonase YvrE [Oppia nitens]|uniref:putative sugar lactone lactonase YvrE n=1 Tax=Oppia nitens TaxID=1686743 RepID=UPI0023DCBAEA|nr:putative sugar lactone lactonase YvrE [Oppia nitens]
MSLTVEPISDTKYHLAEGPFWDHKHQNVYFVDAFVGDIHQFDIKNSKTKTYQLKDLVTIVIPYEDNSDILLITLSNQIIKYDTRNGNQEMLASIALPIEGKERFNDGKIDGRGRLWIGSVVNGSNGIVAKMGNLYKFEKNRMIKMSEGFTISNGMTWNQNYTKLYFNDSEDQKIYVFDYDLQNGLISNKTIFVNIKTSDYFKSNEYPDGLTIDVKGYLWTALYGGSRVVQIDVESGNVINSITIPSPLTTSVAFGGPNMNQLFVTSGNEGKDEYKNSGQVFRITSNDPNFKALRFEQYFNPNS